MTAINGASDVNGLRHRSTKAEVAEFKAQVFDLVAAAQPCSVRHAYYLAVTAGLVPKDRSGKRDSYTKVMRAIGDMRENCTPWVERTVESILREGGEQDNYELRCAMLRRDPVMPWEWIVDHTRLRRGPRRWSSAKDALEHWARAYRRDLWERQGNRVEVWCESDSIAGVISETTWDLGVDLMPTRGQNSKTFAHSAAVEWDGDDREVVVIYIGDFDPNGIAISDSLEERLRRYAEDRDIQEIHFRRLAVNPEQIGELGLTGHEMNPTGSGVERFRALCDEHGLPYESVESEAIDPNALRELLEDAVMDYVDEDAWEAELAVEQAERDSLAAVKLPA